MATHDMHAAQWQLVWSDEFDYHGLPDPTKWDYEEGFIRGTESQYYTSARLENARVDGRQLIIECRKESFTPPNHPPVAYTAASLITKHSFTCQYGRIEVRAKLPSGKGVWPAIWMLGASYPQVTWPQCGEIDIMEFVGHDPDNIYAHLHYHADGRRQFDRGVLPTIAPAAEFHVYACEWFADRIDFYFDTQKYHSVLTDKAGVGPDNPFRKPHYLLINFALGGAWGGPIDDTILPQTYRIDYVRIYQQAAP